MNPVFEAWQIEIVNEKLQAVEQHLFSLGVDYRVAKRIGDQETMARAKDLIKRAEAQKEALNIELQGKGDHDRP